jgi:hypothetical protein
MKQLKIWLVTLLCIASFAVASPVLADRIAKKSPDYPVVVENLNSLLELQSNPEQSEYSPEELQQKISDLKLQKYVLETSEDWGVCRNETGKTLSIYARNPKKGTPNTIFYLANGEETDDNWDCEGIYIPNDVKVASLNLPSGESSVVKILDGTNLTISSSPNTNELLLDIPSALLQTINASDTTWTIPNLTQADIDAQAPNAPID